MGVAAVDWQNDQRVQRLAADVFGNHTRGREMMMNETCKHIEAALMMMNDLENKRLQDPDERSLWEA